ncbi:MAG: MFS transporter [Solirubrobacteraceae bacterium]
MSSPRPGAPAVPTAHPRTILAVILLAGLSFALSQTMIVPALPRLTDELDTTRSATAWLLTAYLLSASVCTPLVGKLGDLYGKGRTLTIVLLLFSLGSVICALAPSVEVMIAGRVVQGVAGGVFPLSFGIIRDTFPPDRVAGAIGLQSAVFGIGGGIGLPLAGVIVDHTSPAVIFWIGLIALPAALAAYRLVPPSPPVRSTRVDWPGALLLSVGLATILLALSQASSWGWGDPATLGLLLAGVVVIVVWVRVEQTRTDPLIDIAVLRRREVAATNATGFLAGFAMFSSFLLIPQFAQAAESTGYGFGMSVTESGLLMLPSSVMMLIAGPLAGRWGARFGFRATLVTGTASSALSFGFLALEHGDPWHFIVSGALLGVGLSFTFASMANLIVAAVPRSDVGIATGINTVTRTVGGAFGSGAVTAIITASTIGDTSIPSGDAYTTAFVLAAGVGIGAMVMATFVPRPGRPTDDGAVPVGSAVARA